MKKVSNFIPSPNVIPTTKKKKSKLGRKKVEDKKMPITIYLQQSVIDKLGGSVELRETLLKKVQEEINNLK